MEVQLIDTKNRCLNNEKISFLKNGNSILILHSKFYIKFTAFNWTLISYKNKKIWELTLFKGKETTVKIYCIYGSLNCTSGFRKFISFLPLLAVALIYHWIKPNAWLLKILNVWTSFTIYIKNEIFTKKQRFHGKYLC